MAIENLLKVLPPPAAPCLTFDGPWEPIEYQLGTPLPQDYKDFVRIYGRGQFMQFFGLYMPVCQSPYARLVSAVYGLRDFIIRDETPGPMWPQRGGLLGCGQTDNGDHLFWLTRGPLAEWPIVVWDRGYQQLETFECDLTDFLAGIVSGEILPKGFPYLDLLEGEEPFTPAPDHWPGAQ